MFVAEIIFLLGEMKNFIRKIENRIRTIITEPSPDFAKFSAAVSEEMKRDYRGGTADIFFANDQGATHKWLHYFKIYDEVFEPYVGSKIRMLEIGVKGGGSLELWRKFLGASATIFGIDIDPACARHDGRYGFVRIGSQDDATFLSRVVNEMGGIDVVLDDGSHIGRHQRASFNVLFPLLSDGGLYLIEDMHTSYWLDCEGGLKRRGTAIEFLKDKIDQMHEHYRASDLNSATTMLDIESIQFFDSIAVIRKRKQLPRYHVQSPASE